MPKSNLDKYKKTRKIYLDYASAALSTSSNPGAIHEFGVKEKNKLQEARTTIGRILNAHNDEIIFTSGATESNNLAILGLVQNFKKPHIVTTNIEHSSVLEVCKHLEKTKQAEVSYVAVEKNGIVDPKKIKKALKENTVLISVMYANNEIGTIQPIREIAKEIRHWKKNRKGKFSKQSSLPIFHTDATQAVNYLSINVAQLGVDLMSFNSAKIYGPKGIAALYVKRHTPVSPIMFGGDQEFGLRPGTESVALAAEFAKVLQFAESIKESEAKRLTKLRDYFLKKVLFSDSFLVNGDPKNRLPNNINITIQNIPSDLMVIELSARGIMASAKSACKAGDGKASHVIEAINKNIREMDGSLRFSLGRETTKKDIDDTLKALSEILTKLKKWYS